MEVGRQEMLDNPSDLKLRLILLDLLHRACYRQHNMGNVLEAHAHPMPPGVLLRGSESWKAQAVRSC